MTFFGNIVYLRPRRARAANDTTRAQINNIPEKSHVIPLLTLFIPGFFAPATGKAGGGGGWKSLLCFQNLS